MTKQPVSYLQTDPKWKNLDYSAPGEKTTIGAAGCGPTSAAMIASTMKQDNGITPVTAVKWSLAHGGKAKNQGTYYSFFTPYFSQYGITCTQINTFSLRDNKSKAQPYHDKALQAIKDGNYVIACMGPGLWTTGGHFIVWYDYKDNQVLINDPASTRADRLKSPLTTLQNEVKYYFVIEVPKPIDPPKKFEVEMGIINIEVSGTKLTCEGFNFNGRTFIGIREYAEKLGAKVGWNDETKSVIISL